MKLTEEIVHAKMRFQMERAKKELLKSQPENDPDKSPVKPAVVAIWHNGLEKEYRAGWSNNREKQIWGEAISRACALTHVSVIIARLITTLVNSQLVCQELNVDGSKVTFEEYQKLLLEWTGKTSKTGRFSGLPEKFRLDCITICAMGPRFKDRILNQPYEYKDGTWQFPQSRFANAPEDYQGQINVIPKWWQ